MSDDTEYFNLLSSSFKFDEEVNDKIFLDYVIDKKYNKVQFNNCTYNDSFFKNVEFENCRFDYCSIENFVLKNVKFKNCIFFFCNFKSVDLECQFYDADLFETHFTNDCEIGLLDDKSRDILYDFPSIFEDESKKKSQDKVINRAEFIKCTLHSVDFDNKDMVNSLFKNVSFQLVSFKNQTNLSRAYFTMPREYFNIYFDSSYYDNSAVKVNESTIFPNMKELKSMSSTLTIIGYLNEFITTFKNEELLEMIRYGDAYNDKIINFQTWPFIYISNFFVTVKVLYETKESLYSGMSDTYMSIANTYSSNDMKSDYGEYYYLGKKLKHKTLRGRSKFKSNLAKWFCGYGERWWYGVFMSFAIIFACASFFMTGLEDGSYTINYYFTLDFKILKDLNWNIILKDYWSCLYFSMMTFTTVGYGNMEASGPISQAISFLKCFLVLLLLLLLLLQVRY